MKLEIFIQKLPWGEKSKMASFLGISKVTVTNYGRPKDHPRKIKPTPERARMIEKYSLGKVTLEDIYGKKRAQEIRRIWGDHGEI